MLKIGVFGVGQLGKFHLENWQQIGNAGLIGFFDPDEQVAKDVSNRYHLKRFTDAERLMQEADIIDVTAPTIHHFDIANKAIRKGKHVFVEKPMTNTMEEARVLVKLAGEAGIKFQVGHIERFNPAFLAIKELVHNPRYIEVHRHEPFDGKGSSSSVILDLMIHDIDIILSIVKSDVKSISASGVSVLTDSPDVANVRLEFLNGCVTNLTSSRIASEKTRKIDLFQKDAFIAIDLLNNKSRVTHIDKAEINGSSPGMEESQQGNMLTISDPPIPEVNAIRKELEEFMEAITDNTKTAVSEMDGLMAMDVAHQILDKLGSNLVRQR